MAEPSVPRADQDTRSDVESAPTDVREVHDDWPWKTAGINAGVIVASNTTKLRLDSRTLGRAIELDLENVFGFDETVAGARAEADEVRRLTPNIVRHVHRIPFRDKTVSERLASGLRKASLDIPDEPAADD